MIGQPEIPDMQLGLTGIGSRWALRLHQAKEQYIVTGANRLWH